MAWKKALRIARELADLVATGYVQGKGKVARPCSPDRWGAGMDTMIEMASTGQLTLPMKSHNYLVAIVWQEADKADANAESKHRAQEQTGHVRPAQPPLSYQEDHNPYEEAYEAQHGPGSLDRLSRPELISKVKDAMPSGEVAAVVASFVLDQKTKVTEDNAGYSNQEKIEFYMSLDNKLQEAFIDAGRDEQHRIMRLPAEQRHDAVRELI